jgi:hypothetical protein
VVRGLMVVLMMMRGVVRMMRVVRRVMPGVMMVMRRVMMVGVVVRRMVASSRSPNNLLELLECLI